MADRVLVCVADGVADVRLNRPGKRNALDLELFRALDEAGRQVAARTEVRAVVLSGAGGSFCSGLDLSILGELAAGTGDGGWLGELSESGLTHRAQQLCWQWRELPVPVIAAVHGHAIGGGAQLALAADVRISRADAQWSIPEVEWGLIPDMTGTLTLSRLVGDDVARELTYTGRTIDGAEAARIGLVTRVADDPHAAALALAAEIAGRNPFAVRGAKALFGRMFADQAGAQFAAERATIRSLVGSPNQVEAVAARIEQRPPRFADPGE